MSKRLPAGTRSPLPARPADGTHKLRGGEVLHVETFEGRDSGFYAWVDRPDLTGPDRSEGIQMLAERSRDVLARKFAAEVIARGEGRSARTGILSGSFFCRVRVP